MTRSKTLLAAGLLGLLLVGLVGAVAWGPLVAGEHDRATVTVADENGTELATVDAEVADSAHDRYVGLSEHESLDEHEGMLFVFDEQDERTFVMRNMSFPIDIVFADADGEITAIEEAPEPDGEYSEEYTGTAQYVLEVRYGYAADHGIEVGDRIEYEYES